MADQSNPLLPESPAPLAPPVAPTHEPSDDPQYHSLYRRFRPQRFAEVVGQDHITRALQNALRDGRVAHAYLFSGPRGTGKTSTARILAMALNCADPRQGEPCGRCDSCIDIRRGASVDVHELDAASNRKLDEMRDLLSRVALATRGRWKVYIIDEVHQLTGDAASALLKTLEEPPGHVVFVLATTDPQKVLDTIRSRTLHFEFHLLPSEVLGGLLRSVNTQAGLGVSPEAIDLVVRKGHGSARDALTVLDQVAAAGGVEDEATVVAEIVDGLADRDVGRVLLAVAEGMASGRDARRLAADLLEHLRNGFLATMAKGLVMLPDEAAARVEKQARRLGPAALVRAMEGIGEALAAMRDSVDPRVTLEVALVRQARPEADHSPAALLERIERLERAAQKGAARSDRTGIGASAETDLPQPSTKGQAVPGKAPDGIDPMTAAAAMPALGAHRRPAPTSATGSTPSAGPALSRAPVPGGPTAPAGPGGSVQPPPASPGGSVQPAPAGPGGSVQPPPPHAPNLTNSGGSRPSSTSPPGPAPPRPEAPPPSGMTAAAGQATPLPSRDELTKAWGDGVLRGLPGKARSRFATGRFIAVEGGAAVFGVPDKHLLGRCEETRPDAEAALAARFGRPVPLRLVLEPAGPYLEGDGGTPADEPTGGLRSEPPGEADAPLVASDLADLEDAGPAVTSPAQRLMEAFPGAEEVSP